jgi:hypothetical protein
VPSSKNYKRDYQQEKVTDRARGGIKKRAERNAARAAMMKAGKVHKGDGKDVDHARPLGKGGSTSPSNLRVTSASSNRSFKRNSKGGIVSQTSKREARRGRK